MIATTAQRQLVTTLLLVSLVAAVAVAGYALMSPSSPGVRGDQPQGALHGTKGQEDKETRGQGDKENKGKPLSLPLSRAVAVGEPPPEDAGNMPEEWRGGGDYTLRVQKLKLPLPGAAQEGGPQEVEMVTYNGRLVGPTIRVRRGTTLKIKVINDLPKTGAPPLTVDPNQDDPAHELYITNLHTHGLHVSPEGNSDNIFREIPPGASFQYTYTIPPDHPTGTFWYHPHKHGSVAYQMANGLAGALIVEDGPSPGRGKDEGARNLDDIPEIASAKERILVLQQLILERDPHGVGRVDPNDVYNDQPGPDAYQVTAINGVVLPTYTMHPKEVQRWRFIHAGREEPIPLGWRDDKGQPMRARSIVFHRIAIDGLATGTITQHRFLRLYPGYRSDVLIKAPAETGTYYLAAAQEFYGPSGPKTVVKNLAKVVVQGAERDMPLPTAAQLADCKPFPSINPAACQVKRDVVFDYDDKKKIFHINGLSFSQQTRVDRPLLGLAEEWTLTAHNAPDSPDDPHPFHIHVNPFQVVQIEDLATKVVTKVDEWHDTIVVENGKKVTIRIRFLDFPGKTVLHCHTLDHGDQGMMRTIQIVDPKRPGDGSDEPGGHLTECSIPAPSLKLPLTAKATWELSALRQRNVVLVFFRGMGCIHCTRQLRNLLQEARDLADTDTVIVAVSSEPIANLDHAIKSLHVPPGLGFHLLVDEDQRGFRSFGCYEDGPQHGLFVIDKKGTIRAKYVGEVPFADAPQVCARVRQLRNVDRQGRPKGGPQRSAMTG